MDQAEFLSKIYLEYADFLRLICRKKTGYVQRYEGIIGECIQDTFVLAAREYRTLRHHPCVRAWLARTCLNRLIPKMQQLRYREERTAFSLDDEMQHETQGVNTIDNYLEKKTRHSFLVQFYSKLSVEEANIYQHYFVQNKTMRQIAIETGVTENQVRYAIQRIREKARKEFAEFEK